MTMIGWMLLALVAVIPARRLAVAYGLVEWESGGRKLTVGSTTSLAVIGSFGALMFIGAGGLGGGGGGVLRPGVVVSGGGGGGGAGDSVSIIFYSGWDAATGNTSTAINDGGIWTGDDLCGSAQGWDSVQVVTTAPGTPPTGITNAMRHEYAQNGGTGAGLCGGVLDTTLVDGQDIYIRVWMYTDETQNIANHALTIADGRGGNAFQFMLGKDGTPSGWILQVKGPNGDIPHWGTEYAFYAGDPNGWVRDTLNFNEWYRFEALVDYLGDTAGAPYRMYPRVYNAAGTLIYDDSTFIGSSGTLTLQTAYAAGDSFPVQVGGDRTTLALAQEGANGLTDNRGEYFWWAGLAVSDSTWVGDFVPGGD